MKNAQRSILQHCSSHSCISSFKIRDTIRNCWGRNDLAKVKACQLYVIHQLNMINVSKPNTMIHKTLHPAGRKEEASAGTWAIWCRNESEKDTYAYAITRISSCASYTTCCNTYERLVALPMAGNVSWLYFCCCAMQHIDLVAEINSDSPRVNALICQPGFLISNLNSKTWRQLIKCIVWVEMEMCLRLKFVFELELELKVEFEICIWYKDWNCNLNSIFSWVLFRIRLAKLMMVKTGMKIRVESGIEISCQE